MTGVWLSAALCCLQTANPDLGAALDKVRHSERYAFKIERTHQVGESAQNDSIEGRFQKDQPVWMKSGELEVYRKGEALVHLRKSLWTPIPVKDSDRRRTRDSVAPATLRTLRLPHEELAGLEKRFTEIKKLEAKEGDQTVYAGELTEDAAKAFADANTERKLEGAPAGTGRFWVTPAGELAMVELIVRVKAKGKGARDPGVSMWITLSDVGTAKVEAPESAVKALDEK